MEMVSRNYWSFLITIVLVTIKGPSNIHCNGIMDRTFPPLYSRVTINDISRYPTSSDLRAAFVYQCPQLDINNGYVRHSRRTARFRCLKNYTLLGDSVVHCIAGEWTGEIPVCGATGCFKAPSPKHGTISKQFRDISMTVNCDPGYSVEGSSTIYCDGHYWNASFTGIVNMCKKSLLNPSTRCNFENHDQCGWTSQDPDRVTIEGPNSFGYRPYGLALTDHTGTGHMLVVWSSISQNPNISFSNRLYSPVYDTKESESCFTFWYHLGGYDKQLEPPSFNVYIKPESMALTDVTPWVFTTTSDAYGQWTSGQVYIPKVTSDWQIVLEFNIYQKVYGLDDFSIDRNVTKCATRSLTTGIADNWISCKNRCSFTPIKGSSCSCSILCTILENCCPDYEIYCKSNSTKDNDDDFDKMYFNETTTLSYGLITSSTTLRPVKWIFTTFPSYMYRGNDPYYNISKVYFPTETIEVTKAYPGPIATNQSTATGNTATKLVPVITTQSSVTTTTGKSMPLSTETIGKSTHNKIDSHATEMGKETTTILSTTHSNINLNVPENNHTTLTSITPTVTVASHEINDSNHDSGHNHTANGTIDLVGIESRSFNSEKGELSAQNESNMKMITILIGLFMIASLVGVVFLWKRHQRYLGSSVSVDSELRFLAQEDDG